MIPRDVRAPTIPVPFHKLLKVVAIVDAADAQTKQLIDHIAAQNFEVEISHSFEIGRASCRERVFRTV